MNRLKSVENRGAAVGIFDSPCEESTMAHLVMTKIIPALCGVVLMTPGVAISSAFTDPVQVDSVSEADAHAITFVITPPGLFSKREASWPVCSTVSVRVVRQPEFSAVKPEQHEAAIKRLKEAQRSKTRVHFGPAGKGLVPSKDNRCQLNSKGLAIIQRSDGKEAVISFYSE